MSTNQVSIDQKTIKLTQEALGKLIKKPVLTEKLLQRPPFKFLHDIITNVISSTGYMKEIFNSDDLNPSIQKDKEGKIAFLQKVIDIVGSTLGKPVDVKAAKIVAGLEPDKTNQFLQALGKAAIISTRGKKEPSTPKTAINNSSAAKSPLKGKATNRQQQINKTTVKQTSKASTSLTQPVTKGKRPSNVNIDLKKRQSVANSDDHRQNSDESKQDKVKRSDLVNNGPDDKGDDKGDEGDVEPLGSKSEINSDNHLPINQEDQSSLSQIKEDIGLDESYKIHKPEDNNVDDIASRENVTEDDSSAENIPKGLPQLMVRPPTGNVKGHSPRASPRPSARPTTARAAPPKVITKSELQEAVAIDQPRVLQSSEPVENLIAEKSQSGTSLGPRSALRGNQALIGRPNDEEEDDEDAMFVVQEVKNIDLSTSIESAELLGQNISSRVSEEDKSKGSLVKQLVETKVTLEGRNKSIDESQLKVDSTTIGLSNRLASRDINKLRESIQHLTQLATPLGRILDYLQEDINSIVTELRGWVDEHSRNMVKLQEEKSSLDTHLKPFKVQLEHLDNDITRIHEAISIRKASILRNEEKIEKIIKMAVEKSY